MTMTERKMSSKRQLFSIYAEFEVHPPEKLLKYALPCEGIIYLSSLLIRIQYIDVAV